MSHTVLTYDALIRALALRDLTDPLQGPHALQQLVDVIHTALAARWGCQRQVHRACPIVSVADNYDRLGYPPDGAARDVRYTRYLSEHLLLRTQTSAMIPGLLRALALDPPVDVLLRLSIRDPVRTLTSVEANVIRDCVYQAVHEGERMEWTTSSS